ncbi:MAG: primosomal protein N' [Bacteroidales bacterium]
MNSQMFAEVLLPLPVEGTFTYAVPEDLRSEIIQFGRVTVQFGTKKIYSGLVISLTHQKPDFKKMKPVLALLDREPVINELQYRFWKWLAQYYMCTLGEVMQAALPAALKLASETILVAAEGFDPESTPLTDSEYLVFEAIDIHKTLTIGEVEKITGRRKTFPLIKSLIDKGVVHLREDLQERYKPLKETYIALAENWRSEQQMMELMNNLEKRAYRQLEVLMRWITLSKFGSKEEKEVSRKELAGQEKSAASALQSLIKKGVFVTYQKTVSRLPHSDQEGETPLPELSPPQQKAINSLRASISAGRVALLHGVTSSGKTEVYVRLIREIIDRGQQVLFLLPEIALTTQIIGRLRKYFGDIVGVYHSKYSTEERYEIWHRVAGHKAEEGNPGKYQIILGPRSALFLPFTDLGLVIVDEEHDASYKQFEPAPYYHARDAAIYLASLTGAGVILGTATPSIESYFNTTTGKYDLVEMHERYGEVMMPEILIADLKQETRRRTMKSLFSSLLLDHMRQALEQNEQVILFQNRRGYAPRLVCMSCGATPECRQCDVSLIYHKHKNELRCHYCGWSRHVPPVCDVCGSSNLKMFGFGTEKVEDELTPLFPEARIRRMDLDTTRSKHSYQQIITDFEEQRIDILVGTQMVTKGLDFDHVGVVGILHADHMLAFPDFRAHERSFQQMAQVSGRAGRKNRRGRVIIQTWNPGHPVIHQVKTNNYLALFNQELAERRKYYYPPYCRLIRITLKHRDKRKVEEAAEHLAKLLRTRFDRRVLGPESPVISRIRNQYLMNILLKLERGKDLINDKTAIKELIKTFFKEGTFRPVRIITDADPV